MSLVPFTTQIGQPHLVDTQNSQRDGARIVFIYFEKMNDRQILNMKQSQQILRNNLECIVRQANDLITIPPKTRQFVIPYRRDDVVDKIKKRFDRPLIYLPKAILEARGHYNVKLPNRTFAISLGMSTSQIFIVRTCDSPNLRVKINEMTGKIVRSFDSGTNVVVTDRADDKYCARAIKRGIPVVSKDWVDELHREALDDDLSSFNQNALDRVKEFKVKAFYGLYFKMNVRNVTPELKQIIIENDGNIVYGNENCLTHIVDYNYIDNTKQDDDDIGLYKKVNSKVKIVDVQFVYSCANCNYYLTPKDYEEYKKLNQNVLTPKDQIEKSMPIIEREENYTPPFSDEPIVVNMCDSFDGGSSRVSNSTTTTSASNPTSPMLPPPPPPAVMTTAPTNKTKSARLNNKHKPEMNEMILKALSSFGTEQTQHASTQMRRLPDPELQIEKTFEPSQQLYWIDSVGRKN